MNEYLFVYGLLRSHFDHPVASYLHSHGTLVGTGYLHGVMYDAGGYPAICLTGKNNDRVIGEVFRISAPEKVLPQLDDFEQIGPRYRQPYEYERRQCTIRLPGKVMTCWVYLYNWPIDGLRRISSGDYVKHIARGDTPVTGSQGDR